MAPRSKSNQELEQEKKELEATRDYLKSLQLEKGTEAFAIRTTDLTRIRNQISHINRLLNTTRHDKYKQLDRERKMNSTTVSQTDNGCVLC